MANRLDDTSAARRNDDPSIGGIVDLVKSYAKQETLGPLKGAGKWLAFGAIGAVLLGFGLALLLLGVLRLIQTEWEWAARGSWSWISYLVVLVACVVIIVLSISRINKASLNKERD